MSIAFFGEALYDCYSDLSLPAAVQPLVLRANIGGGVLNAAVGAKRWLRHWAGSALPVSFIGGISVDHFGRRILELLRAEEIHTDYCYDSQATTALSIVLNDATGERSFNFYRHQSADLDYPQEQWRAEWFHDLRIFACDTNCMTTEEIFASNMTALEHARQSKTMVAIDVNIRPVMWSDEHVMRSRIRRALCYATVIKFSAEELALIFSGNDEQHHIEQLFMLANRTNFPRVLCVSRGQEGCSVYLEQDRAAKPIHIPAERFDAVDTTGAGDAFFGILCAYLTLHPLAHTTADRELLQQAAAEATTFATGTVMYQGALSYAVARPS